MLSNILKQSEMKEIEGRLLYLISESRGLLFKQLAFYEIDLGSGEKTLIANLPADLKTRALSHSRFAVRLLRLEPRCTGRLDETHFAVCALGKVWLLDTQKRRISELLKLRQGYNVLNFCEREESLFWGDYGWNPNHDEINIYRLDSNLNKQIVYKFPHNSVRHIHNIIKDVDGFIVLAGDNEAKAGIYKANADWTEVKPWKCGEQKYRAVVGFSYKGGLLYATDSVEKENHLRYISSNGDEKKLIAMNGSCIYGGETKGYYVFSTTVESPEGGGKLGMLSRKLGGGIKSDEVFVIAVSKENLSIKEIGKFKKDFWPMKLMQYGQAIFAGGQEGADTEIWCSPISCVKYDGKSICLKLNE